MRWSGDSAIQSYAVEPTVHPILCTVLMQGKKPKHFEWIDFSSNRKMNSELWWSPPGAKCPSSRGCPWEGAKQQLPPPEPCGSCGHQQALFVSQPLFHVKGWKNGRKTLWIWRSKPSFKSFVHFVSRGCDPGPHSSYVFEMHPGGLMFMWNSFDKSRQMWVRKVNETKSSSMKLGSLLTQCLWGNTSNIDGHLTTVPSNFHRCN